MRKHTNKYLKGSQYQTELTDKITSTGGILLLLTLKNNMEVFGEKATRLLSVVSGGLKEG